MWAHAIIGLRRSCFCLGLLAGITPTLVSAKEKGLDILITADAVRSPEGFRPKPDKPIHYLLFQSRETLGSAIAGVKLPSVEVVDRAVIAELKKQGFLRTEVGGPIPEIVIFAVVGDSNFKDENPVGNPWNDDDLRTYLQGVSVRQVAMKIGMAVGGSVQAIFNNGDEPYEGNALQEAIVDEARRLRNRNPARKRQEIMNLVGARKLDRAVEAGTLNHFAARRIADAALDDRFYISLSALEAKKQPDGSRAFLWRTAMLIDWREDFTEALPAMLAEAGPLIGTDVAVSGFVNTRDSRRADVEIGEAKIVPENDPPKKNGPKK